MYALTVYWILTITIIIHVYIAKSKVINRLGTEGEGRARAEGLCLLRTGTKGRQLLGVDR